MEKSGHKKGEKAKHNWTEQWKQAKQTQIMRKTEWMNGKENSANLI